MKTIKEHESPCNWAPESIRRLSPGRRIIVQDLTLEGDGEEMAGLRPSDEDRIAVARRIDEIGAPRTAVLGNPPRPAPDGVRAAEKIAALGLETGIDLERPR